MAKALIVFATRAGETDRIANLIAEGIRFSGVEASVVNVVEVKSEKDLMGYDAVVLGSSTYHGEMLSKMKTLLFMAEKAGLEGKVGGAFGALAAIICPNNISGTNSPTRQPSSRVRMPKTIRPVERSL